MCIADTYIQDQYLGTKEFYLKLCLPYSSVKWPFFINNGDTLPYVKLIASWNLLYDAGNPKLVLCDNPEGWERMEGGMEV